VKARRALPDKGVDIFWYLLCLLLFLLLTSPPPAHRKQVNRLLVVGRDALHKVAENFAQKYADLGQTDVTGDK
jgi:hypothetical protein